MNYKQIFIAFINATTYFCIFIFISVFLLSFFAEKFEIFPVSDLDIRSKFIVLITSANLTHLFMKELRSKVPAKKS